MSMQLTITRRRALSLAAICAAPLQSARAQTPAAPAASATAGAPSACQSAPAGIPTSGKPAYLQGAVLAPAARQVRYEGPVQYKGISARARSLWAWQHDGQQYQLQVSTKVLLLETTETSTGAITPEGLRPMRYLRTGRGARSASFDAKARQISFDNGACAALAAGVQDNVSAFVQLAAVLGGAPAKYPIGASITLPVATNRSLRAWVFKIDGEENLSLRAGAPPLRCIRLVRQGAEPDTLWLAPSLGYWPARLKVMQEGGDFADQSLRL